MMLTSFFLLAASVNSFRIPAGQPNGVYSVDFDTNGNEVHTLLKLTEYGGTSSMARGIDSSSKLASERRDKHDTSSVNCAGYALNDTDTDIANDALDEQCSGGTGVGGHSNFYSIANCTVAYFCNFNAGGDTCSSSERQEDSRLITSQCGLYNAGWVDLTTNTRYNSYGYEGFCAAGRSFCGHGTHGRQAQGPFTEGDS